MKTLYEIVDGKLVATQASEKQRSPFDAVIEEYSGWREYTRLAEESGDNAYAVAAHEEFRHMLLRLSKALVKIESMATTDAEKAELKNFYNSLLA